MDKVEETFDAWAKNGRSELMEEEHGKNVSKFFSKVKFEKPFTFLDVGCGNGWVVRKIASLENCKKSIGIDKSKNMISQAKKLSSSKGQFFHTDIESYKTRQKFDYIFSMESLYYADSIEKALKKIHTLLNPGGQFVCGTDFYSDNKATTRWKKVMNIQMHLHSKKEWRTLFKNEGFDVKIKQVKDLKNNKKWKREFGTLFIIGVKPKK